MIKTRVIKLQVTEGQNERDHRLPSMHSIRS